jgi:AcrR family transcriptional regulator
MTRMTPSQRRDAIVDAALSVALTKGLGSTTVRDVAAAMGTSSGLIHHYFESMDDVLAAAFERVAAADLEVTATAMAATASPTAAIVEYLRTYAPADKDWAFQFWLDAWSEAARRPALRATSRRLNLAWQELLQRTIVAGVASGELRCDDPVGAAWRIVSMLDGLALQVVAHGTTVRRPDVAGWAATAAELELGLARGTLAGEAQAAAAGRRRRPVAH